MASSDNALSLRKVDAYYGEMTPCPGCGADWEDDHIVHYYGCELLAQFDAEDES